MHQLHDPKGGRSRLSQLTSIPNLLSLLRIVLIPIFIYVYLTADSPRGYVLSTLILAVSGLSDFLDGFIARHFHMITDVGKILDPVADKLTQLSIIVCLMLRFPLYRILFVVLLVKEVMMLAAGFLLMHKKIHPGSSKWFGKLATFFFYISMLGVVLFPGLDPRIANLVAAANILLFVFALGMYIPVFFKLKRGRL